MRWISTCSAGSAAVRFAGWFGFGAAFAFSWLSVAGVFAVPIWMGLLIVLTITGRNLRPNRPGKTLEYAGIPVGLAAMCLFVWALNPGWWGFGLAGLLMLLVAAAVIITALREIRGRV